MTRIDKALWYRAKRALIWLTMIAGRLGGEWSWVNRRKAARCFELNENKTGRARWLIKKCIEKIYCRPKLSLNATHFVKSDRLNSLHGDCKAGFHIWHST